MGERPILFSGPMVRAILAGTKTQTRRVMNPQPDVHENGFSWHTRQQNVRKGGYGVGVYGGPAETRQSLFAESCRTHSPYGASGDRLWVRETWRDAVKEYGTGYEPAYRATCSQDQLYRWRHSIFMPRWASRITLELTDVRVQRLQDISGEDTRAEGVENFFYEGYDFAYSDMTPALANFRRLWDSINGKKAPWSSNPFVWALTFKRIESPTPAAAQGTQGALAAGDLPTQE